MTRDELDAALWHLVHRAQALVGEARDAVREGAVCGGLRQTDLEGLLSPGNWFGDEAACNTLRANAATLDGRVLDLASHVVQVTSKRDEDLTNDDVRRVQAYADAILSEAANLFDASRLGLFAEYVRETVEKFVRFFAEVAAKTLTIVGDVAGAAAGGLLSGLGPWGTLIAAGALYLAFFRSRA
jgi:hypothetical protein